MIPRERAFLILLAVSALSSGCIFTRITSPNNENPQEMPQTSIMVSFKAMDVRRHEGPGIPDGGANLKAALTAVLKENGINNPIESNQFDSSHLNIIVYQTDSAMSTGTRFLGMPLGMLAGFSMLILPARGSDINPIEVHAIDPLAEKTKQFKIYRTQWTKVEWLWLGFGLFKDKNEKDDRVMMGRGVLDRKPKENQMLWDRLETTGLKRALRPIIREILADRMPSK